MVPDGDAGQQELLTVVRGRCVPVACGAAGEDRGEWIDGGTLVNVPRFARRTPMVATAPALDMQQVQTFAFKVLGDITAAQMGPLSVLADRLGLFAALTATGPATVPEFALRAGGSVADVGCGNGQALLFLASGYPDATLTGYDNYPPAIAAANANARAAGLEGRVRYELCDATQGLPGTYDLITSFDVVHDMPRPRPALSAIRRALKPDGTYFVLEFNFSGDLQQNIDHPMGIGAFGYSASTNYCMTQALAVGGEGTGTCMGEERARELATEAGFGHFRRLDFPSNPFNLFYEIRI
jgi:SAM-dependent methyltransferase